MRIIDKQRQSTSGMGSKRTLSVISAHAAGELGEVVVGGLLDVPGATMFDKMVHFKTKADHLRRLLVNEPRGRPEMSVNFIVPPCNPQADAGLIITGPDTYVPMSGSNTICSVTVLLETGMLPMQEPVTTVVLDTAAGLVTATGRCKNGKCEAVSFDNVPAFVWGLGVDLNVPGLGEMKVDVAYGGQFYVHVDATAIGLLLEPSQGRQLVQIGQAIFKAAQEQIIPVHPENRHIRGINNIQFVYPVTETVDGNKIGTNAVIVPPGRVDRSPCGTGTSARLAVLHARRQIAVGQRLSHRSVIGSEFIGEVMGTTKVGSYDAVLPRITGSAWLTCVKQVLLDRSDPYPEGFRVGDSWLDTGDRAKL